MPRPPAPPIHLRAARMLDVDTGAYVTPGELLIDGDRIVEVAPTSVPADAVVIDLGDLTLLPGLMDMEVNLFLGGPNHRSPLISVQEDPAVRTLRAVANGRRTLRAGFTTVRNLGLFVQTGGILLDVALKKAIDLGWVEGPRVVPAGHAICPTGGHLDPTMFQAFAPNLLPLTVEEGIANGVSEVRKAVRYQIKYGAQVIKVCASGGVMSHTGPAGAQQYSNEELAAVADEAHRAGLKVAAHAHGDAGIRAAVEAGIDCIEHGSLMSDETMALFIERETFLVPTTYLADGMDTSHADPALQAKAAEVFPKAKATISKAVARGARIACGTDAPAIPHGRNAKELVALVDRGMTPVQAIRAATTVAAELIDVTDRGRLQAGLLADVIAVPGDPIADITVTEDVRFVMKGGAGLPPGPRLAGPGPVSPDRGQVDEPATPWRTRSHSSSAGSAVDADDEAPITAENALNMMASSTMPATGPLRSPARTAPASAAPSSTSPKSCTSGANAVAASAGRSVSSRWAKSTSTGAVGRGLVEPLPAAGRHTR